MLTKQEAAARLNIHEHTVARWAKHSLITSHAYNGHYCLYEIPELRPAAKALQPMEPARRSRCRTPTKCPPGKTIS